MMSRYQQVGRYLQVDGNSYLDALAIIPTIIDTSIYSRYHLINRMALNLTTEQEVTMGILVIFFQNLDHRASFLIKFKYIYDIFLNDYLERNQT